jgi:hypothetical protein
MGVVESDQMPVPTPDTAGAVKTVVETLLKPFTLILNPVAERIGNWLKRKPKLHIYAHPQTRIWCYAWDGGEKPMMQARFDADITNDSHDESIIILDGYIEGTEPQVPFITRIEVPTTATVWGEIVCVFVRPVVGEGGKDFTGRVVLLDQFKRKHLTDEITFKWVGSTERPGTPPKTP